jgi:hypothetical protein
LVGHRAISISTANSPGIRPGANGSLRFENFQGIQHTRNTTMQPSKHSAIDALEGRSFGRFALKYVELMPKNKDLRLKPCPRSEEPGQHALPAT